MAVFSFFPLSSDFDIATMVLDPASVTSSQFILRDGLGGSIRFTGKGLVFSETGFVAGKITGFAEVNVAGQIVASATGLNLRADAFLQAVELAPLDNGLALFRRLTGGHDTIHGSDGEDVLTGGTGNDVIFGGRDADVLFSGLGNDTLTGGSDADVFVFRRFKDGANVITDFQDAGTGGQVESGDDLIGITRRAYRNMEVTQEEDGVLLTFSAGSSVKVLGWTLAEVGIEDFFFS